MVNYNWYEVSRTLPECEKWMKSLREEEIRYELNQMERNLHHAMQYLYFDK